MPPDTSLESTRGRLKPSRKATVLNSIGAMFQFQGGVSDADKESLLSALVKGRHIVLEENDRVRYPEAVSDA